MGAYEIEETADGLNLSATDRELLTVVISPDSFAMRFPAGHSKSGSQPTSGDFEVAISGDFQVADRNGVTKVHTGEVVELGLLLPRVFRREFLGLSARNSGELDLDLRGCSIHVPVDPHYENWSVQFATGQWWWGMPGGGFDLVDP